MIKKLKIIKYFYVLQIKIHNYTDGMIDKNDAVQTAEILKHIYFFLLYNQLRDRVLLLNIMYLLFYDMLEL